MRKLVWVGGFLSVLLCVEPLLAANGPAPDVSVEKKKQDSLRAVRSEKVAAFRAVYPNVTVHINKTTGIPDVLDGDLSPGLTKTDPVEMTYEFFEKNKGLFGMVQPQSELKVKGTSKDQFGGTVAFKQVYKDVDVYQGVMYAHFTPSGRLKYVNGEFYPDIDLSSTPSVDSLSAVGIVKRDLNYTVEQEKRMAEFHKAVGTNRLPVNASLVAAPFENRYHLIWIVDATRMHPSESWIYSVDAHSGAILSKGSALLDNEPSTSIPAPSPIPGKKEKNPEQRPRDNPPDSTPAPKQAPRQESSSPVESVPIPTESWGKIPPSELDSLRSFWKTEKNSSVMPGPLMKMSCPT